MDERKARQIQSVVRADDEKHCGILLTVTSNVNMIGDLSIRWEGNCAEGSEIYLAADSALELSKALIDCVIETTRTENYGRAEG